MASCSPPPDHVPLGLDLTRTGRVVAAAFDAALAGAGGSLATWQVLMTLARRSGAMQREIAAAIGIEGATLTHHLNRLEAEGLVTRTRVPTNRRTHRVELTEAGQERFQALLDHVIAFDAQLRAGFSHADEATLRTLLARLRDNSAGPSEPDRQRRPGTGAGDGQAAPTTTPPAPAAPPSDPTGS